MAPRRLLTRWICVCVALPASIILLFFHLLRPWDIRTDVPVSQNVLPSFPKVPTFRFESLHSAHHTTKYPSYALVLPVEPGDNLAWIPSQLRMSDRFRLVSYVLNDRHSPNAVPSGKGGPVIAFISYIVQQYDEDGLADVSVFMRGKQLGAYNDDLLSNNASKILGRLRSEYVLEIGFTNLFCELGVTVSTNKQGHSSCEELDLQGDVNGSTSQNVAEAFRTVFPGISLPRRLSVLKGGQFAAARRSIRKVPKSTWLRLEQYIITTPLSDREIFDVFSALWSYVFTGRAYDCPDSRKCYCGLYGVCFADGSEYEDYLKLKGQYEELEPAYDSILSAHHRAQRARERKKDRLAAWFSGTKEGIDDGVDHWNTEEGLQVRKRIGEVSQNMWRLRNQAWRRGDELYNTE